MLHDDMSIAELIRYLSSVHRGDTISLAQLKHIFMLHGHGKSTEATIVTESEDMPHE